MSANLPKRPWSFERSSGRVRDADGNCIAQIFEDALESPVMAIADAPLKADCLRLLPGGRLDDSSYEQVESALDRIEAPLRASDGRWLPLAERIAALTDMFARPAPSSTET